MAKFGVAKGEIFLEARYSAPAFDLLRPPVIRLHEEMLKELSRFGATLSNIDIQSDPQRLAQGHINYRVPQFNVTVAVWLDRLEVHFIDSHLMSEEIAIQLAVSAIRGLTTALANISFVTYTVSASLHGTIEGIDPLSFVAQYTRGAPQLGPIVGHAAAFYYGPEENRISSNVVLDTSVIVPNAIFARATVTFNGAQVESMQVPDAARAYIYGALTSLGLELAKE